MSASPVAALGPGHAPLGRVAALGLGRIALAGLVLVLAAVVVTMSGGAGVAGRVGSLFGLRSEPRAKPVAAVEVAGPVAAVIKSVQGARARPQRQGGGSRVNAKRPVTRTPKQSPAPAPSRPAPALPQPPPPVEAPGPPQPAPGGNVEKTTKAVRETMTPVVPQAQPVLDQTAQTVSQVCGAIGGCP
jgi:DNA polymerase-3 subunit gamma/tau